MNCHKFREIMNTLIDGQVDQKLLKSALMHQTECSECAALIDDDSFWDESIRSYLDHKLPTGLRESILGDLADVNVAVAGNAAAGVDPNKLNWKHKRDIAWWAIRRDLSRPKDILKFVALVVGVFLFVTYFPDLIAKIMEIF